MTSISDACDLVLDEARDEHPRVLFVTNMYPTSDHPGYGIIVSRLAEALGAAGTPLEVYSIRGCDDRREYLRARERVQHVVTRYRPDVVHVHFGYSVVATRPLYPRVVSFYGDDLNGTSTGRDGITFKSRVGIGVSLWAAFSCERSIAVSEALRARIPRWLGRDRCITIRDAVDTRLFAPGNRAEARQRLGVPLDAKLVLFPHSPIQPTKRRDLAEAAVRAVRELGTEAELWVVNGKPPESMPLYYRAADLLLVTSDREGGPSCVKEALACGLPVVSVPVGDVEVLREATAWCQLVDRNPAAIARGIVAMLAKSGNERASRLPPELELANAVSRIRSVYRSAISAFRAARADDGPRRVNVAA